MIQIYMIKNLLILILLLYKKVNTIAKIKFMGVNPLEVILR